MEAKAHKAELDGETGGKPLKRNASRDSRLNHERIGKAIDQANSGLQALTRTDGWSLRRDRCFQMTNRFAWAWKLVDLGIPVVLVYLGFLGATEMSDQGAPLSDGRDWHACVKSHAAGMVPEEIWERPYQTLDGSSFVSRIVSVRQSLTAARMPA